MTDEQTKICVKCKEELPATRDFFYQNKRRPDGLRGVCKDCFNELPSVQAKTQSRRRRREGYWA